MLGRQPPTTMEAPEVEVEAGVWEGEPVTLMVC